MNKTKISIAERDFDPRTYGLWDEHASIAPLFLFKLTYPFKTRT